MKVIFFDAVGTLFGVRGSVGKMYCLVAQEFGVALDPDTIDRAFNSLFRAAPPLAFPGCALDAIPRQEYEWWHRLGIETFKRSGDYSKFTDFDRFFARLYDFFASGAPWELYEDVPTALAQLRSAGYRMGIISNFDSRIFSVLQSLQLSDWFEHVIISSYTGAAKPDRGIFTYALEQFHALPEEAFHVGDSQREDYEGAKAAGLSAVWLQRPNQTLMDGIQNFFQDLR
ncbi:MAG: hydrolase [Cyanobacteria bacterium M5B4]|nr:MAG: hydrolase [Cyanobacteria bacterium M5B4]